MGDLALDLRAKDFFSAEEYLRLEELSDVKHEYVDGVLYAMVGARSRHGLIAMGFASSMDRRLPRSCGVYASDFKVHVKNDATERYYYPDVVVTCGAQNQTSAICEEPLLIVEVLSDSTARIDRTEKFAAYRSLSSLNEFVLAHQKSAIVEIFRRANDWRRELFEAGDEFRLDSVDLSFEVHDIYRRVVFDEPGPDKR